MQRLIVEIESAERAKELQSVLSDLKFVRDVFTIDETPQKAYENEDLFFAEIERRTAEMENGSVKSDSLEDLQEKLRKRHL